MSHHAPVLCRRSATNGKDPRVLEVSSVVLRIRSVFTASSDSRSDNTTHFLRPLRLPYTYHVIPYAVCPPQRPTHIYPLTDTDDASTTSIFTWERARSRHGAGAHLPAPGGRQRKLLACALRVCRPRLRHSAASTISRGSPSSTDRLPALRFRHSRGPAQRPLQATAVVQLEVDTSSTMGLQSISGACCIRVAPLFELYSAPLLCRIPRLAESCSC